MGAFYFQGVSLSFFGSKPAEASKPAKSPKRRVREAAKTLKRPAMSTKAQQALAAQREAMKQESAHARSRRRADEADARKTEAQAEASRALIAIRSKANHIQQRRQFHLKPTPRRR